MFRKGVRRGVKARFQNVFDVGGFYVECESEKPPDAHNDIFPTDLSHRGESSLIDDSDAQSVSCSAGVSVSMGLP